MTTPLAALLASGGDERILLDPQTGRNKYGCGPEPDPQALDFASSTASVITVPAYEAVSALYARVQADLTPRRYAHALARQRAELLARWGLEGSGAALVFTASGTDAHLLAARLAGAQAAVMVEDVETGSGARAALEGRHFGALARGREVPKGGLAGAFAAEVAMVGLRTPDARPRPLADVASEFEAKVEGGTRARRRVLAVGVDVSKTGLVAPGLACLQGLAARHPGEVRVLVDACQGRFAPASLRAYLDAGFMVAITGSKFLGGPSFSGALLLPAGPAMRAPSSAAAYSYRAEWPAGWPGASGLPEHADFGLLMRWEAALVELRRFMAVPAARADAWLGAFGEAIAGRLAVTPGLVALPAPERLVPGWDRHPTIFPFLLGRPGGELLSPAATAWAYRALQQLEPRMLLGQPVAVAPHAHALRLCASARHVGQDEAIGEALAVLGQAARLAKQAPG